VQEAMVDDDNDNDNNNNDNDNVVCLTTGQ
jgi:hypothetical protein